MKPLHTTVNDENQEVHLSEKCIDQSIGTIENPALKNLPPKKRTALLSRISYDNVYRKKPISRRKLIEKYSTARYNFNTKRNCNWTTCSKKIVKQSSSLGRSVKSEIPLVGAVFDSKSGTASSKNLRFRANGNVRNVVTRGSVTSSTSQSVVYSKKFASVADSADRVRVSRLAENSITSNDSDGTNPAAKRTPLPRTSNRVENEKTAPNASTETSADGHCDVPDSPKSSLSIDGAKSAYSRAFRCNLRASILSGSYPAESSSRLLDSESSNNLERTHTSPQCEDSDSCESEYLTISIDGDFDSRSSISLNEYSEESSGFANSINAVEHVSGDLPEDARQSTTIQPASEPSEAEKNAKPRFNLKDCEISRAGLKFSSNSDSDSGLQLGGSDNEKSSFDPSKPEGQRIALSQLLSKNVEKTNDRLFSFDKTSHWVFNSSQKSYSSMPESESNVHPSSEENGLTTSFPTSFSDGIYIPPANSNSTSIDQPSKSTSAVSQDVPSDTFSTSVNAAPSASCRDEKGRSNENNDKLKNICSELGAIRENELCEDAKQELQAGKIAEPVSSDRLDQSTSNQVTAQSDLNDSNLSQKPVSILEKVSTRSNSNGTSLSQDLVSPNQNLLTNKATKIENKSSITKWKLVPSAIYHHLSEYYETERMNLSMIPAQKRKKKAKKRLYSAKRYIPTKQVQEEPSAPVYRDPYINASSELQIKEEKINRVSAENVGMILHVGVNRPLFPEIYRNIIALNDRNDDKITDFWASFALTTLITDKSSKHFRSVFLPVKDDHLKSTIDQYQQKTSCEFHHVDLQKVTFRKSPIEDHSDDSSANTGHNTRKRKNIGRNSSRASRETTAKSSPKKRKIQKSSRRTFYEVDFPSNPIADFDSPAKLSNVPLGDLDVEDIKPTAADPVVASLKPTTTKLSDGALLLKHGFKPCQVLLTRVPVPCVSTNAEDDEEDDELNHFFSASHCSRTFGQMLDYRSRNHSLVFFHRIKRILRLQKQNNKLFHSCRYVRLRPDIEEELAVVDVLSDDMDRPTGVDTASFPAEITKNPLDILKTWKLNLFEAPLLKGIDVKANMFPIRFMNHNLLKSETNAKWFILQLNKCVLKVIHANKDHLPVELLFQIICRADLTKKVVCNTIGMDFDPDMLNFGVYGVPGLCEAVVVGPYQTREMQHDLTATVQLWNGEIATIPISGMSFDEDTFFLWKEDAKMSNVYGRWWKPGDAVPCTSAANSSFMNHLFDSVESAPSIERPVRVQHLLMQHPCLTYTKYERSRSDVNIRLIHHAMKLDYTTSGLTVSERIAVEDFIVDNSPLLQPTKLRDRTKMPNYCEMVSPKTKEILAQKPVLKKALRLSTPRISVRRPNSSERMRINTENERMRRKEFSVHRSTLRSAIDASNEESLISILKKATSMIQSMEKEENTLKNTKRNLYSIRKNLIGRLRISIRKFPSNNRHYLKSIELISKLHQCNRADRFSERDLSKPAASPSKPDGSGGHAISVASSHAKPLESREKNSRFAAVVSKISQLKRRRTMEKKRAWRKLVDVRQEPRLSVPESSEKCPPVAPVEEVLRSEHSYSRRGALGSGNNEPTALGGKSLSKATAEVERPPSAASPVFVSLGSTPAVESPSKEERTDQVAVYLTENDLPITKLVIQRLKSANENSRHLSSAERRNQILALIRKMVNETLARTPGREANCTPEERVLVPRLLLLQRLLEGVNMRIRDSSKIRVADQTIEISDDEDEDEDEFFIEPMRGRSGDGESTQIDRRIYVKVSSAQSKSNAPPEEGVAVTQAAPTSPPCDWTDNQWKSEADSVIDEQLSVENQIILNAAGDQVDFCNFVDSTPSLPPPSAKRRRNTAAAGVQRKYTLLKRVNGAVPPLPPPTTSSDTNARETASPDQPEVAPTNDASLVEIDCGSPQSQIQVGPRSECKLLRNFVLRSPSQARVRLLARKTFSSPNYRKLIAQRRAKLTSVLPKSVADDESAETDAEMASVDDSHLKIASKPSISIGDFLNALPESTDKPISPKKFTVVRLMPNMSVKRFKPKDGSAPGSGSGNIIVVPLNGSKSSTIPLAMDERLSTKERLRCPSFVPPPTGPSSGVENEDAPSEVLLDTAANQLRDQVDELIDPLLSFEESREENDDRSPSRSSNEDSSSRLAVRSFASANSFNDNCFNNMDRLLNF